MLEGNWLVGQLRNANRSADFGVFPFPGASRLYGFGEYNYISTKSKNPDVAAKFLDYLEVDAGSASQFGRVGDRREQEREIGQHGASGSRLGQNLRSVQRGFRQRRPSLSAGRDDGIFPGDQRGRQRSSRPARPPRVNCKNSSPRENSARSRMGRSKAGPVSRPSRRSPFRSAIRTSDL